MSIFKYFTMESHARAFIDKGEILLRPLTYFRAYEDDNVRGDLRDGQLNYIPECGLRITKEDGSVIIVEGGRFTSSAKCDDIFVFCASNEKSQFLAKRFGSSFCVEITEPDHLISRLKSRAHPTSKLDYKQIYSGKVVYRNHDQEPDADWALPERLAFLKAEEFAWQDEFRIAVGKRGAFDPNMVECTIETALHIPIVQPPLQSKLVLTISSLGDFSRMYRL